ncbi:MAG: chromosome segregation SMC family protein, partial [Oceanococcaceae bacterium]
MRLTAIRLAGFKSFVDRTELRLGSNLTAIVGPNGCGKSNLIDAVRWVLGESSARQLRGSSLEDVIFTGSRTRKPVGRASIELVFDNSDQTLGGQWGAYAEIAVRRELTRDGQSTFSINGQRCRRKDVTELFLGTGLGPRANYAIIEQGTISRLVEAQPDDLRQMIEEVAGVSRYKEKRRETETRIRHTRENLERLNDIITELDERLAKLKRQVGAAERYKAYRAEQRALRGAHFGLRWQDLAQQRHQGDALVKTAEEAVEQTRRAVADTMVALQGAEEAQAQVAALGRSADEAFYARQAELARIDQEMQHQQQLRSVRQQELAELQAEAKRLDARLQAARQEHVTTDDALSRVDQSLAEATAREANAEQGHSDASEHLAAAQAKLLDARQAAEAPRTAQAREQARAEQLQRQLDALQRREDTLRAELDGLNANAPDANLDSLQTQCQSLAQAQQQTQEAVDAAQTRLQAAREGLKQSAEANRTQQAALSESRARYQVLKA